MKIDLHVHSRFSTRPSQWLLQKINCPESFTEPEQVYRTAKARGMHWVTITDHNTLAGSLEIAHLPNTFISEEVTTYFPHDGCKAHVLVYGITEAIHEDIQKVRENIHDLVSYLQRENVFHVLAHPLFAINNRLTIEHVEQFLLLFKNLELNGARDEEQNLCLRQIVERLSASHLERLAEKHRIEPVGCEPWRKNLTSGSDDHSSLNIARHYTEVRGVQTLQEFFLEIAGGHSHVVGRASTPQTMAHNLYGIAYQFYKSRFRLERHVHKDLFLRFLDRSLQLQDEEDSGLLDKLYYLWSHRKGRNAHKAPPRAAQDLLRHAGQQLIRDDPKLLSVVKDGHSSNENLGQQWFHFANRASNMVLFHFGNHLLDCVSRANFFNIFQSIGSAGSLYAVLSPYFLAFSLFAQDRRFSRQVMAHFEAQQDHSATSAAPLKIAHFTDTYYEVNGVAITLQNQVELARKLGKDLTVITCAGAEHRNGPGIQNFEPIGVYELPEYPEQKLFFPPFLEMLNYCYEREITHIHAATPGPLGLAALAIARILKVPISGTYHTALPQYARYLTEDANIEELVWKYTLWYYNQMDHIYVPSQSTGSELKEKGVAAGKIRVFPRGIDIERFHPRKRDVRLVEARFGLRPGMKLVYVGRVSKEKNLPLLGQVFHSLTKTGAEVQLVVVGDGPYGREFQDIMRGTPTTFTGYLEGEELAILYASCDVFVFPSTTDTFGNVVLEAQASGLPVIVTDMGGPRENLIPGETGLVVKGEDGQALLEAIRTLLGDAERRHRMGEAARRYMEDRSFERAFDQTWNLYQELHAAAAWPLAQAV
jgi:glycosyltransferase involved in cell wall biosynthesis/predicted metal-dependent phosphoesterase TrpH